MPLCAYGSALIKRLGAARRRRPCRPSASPEFNFVELWATKKMGALAK